MENLEIRGEHGDYYVPTVLFNAEAGVCELIGESYLEETVKFYQPLFEWMKEFFETKRPITFDFKLTYFNTSSSKRLLDIMLLLKEYEEGGNEVNVNWHFGEDTDLLEDVEDFMLMSDLNINLKGI